MRYWWVNQNQTFKQEIEGGYLWSPKRNANGGRNPFYEQMREVSPGDLVLSFQGTFIRAVGVARSFAYESPKPTEFGSTGANWGAIGWRVDVSFSLLAHQIKPADHMDRLRVELPRKYSPLRPNGNGLQSVYLTAVPDGMMHALAGLVGHEVTQLIDVRVEDVTSQTNDDGLSEWEERIRTRLEDDTSIDRTEKEQIILARRGQGRFKRNVGVFESNCRITRVDRLEHLRASHIRPWRDCETNELRLDGENGLLLTPTIDHLFDRGFISFESTGRLLISPVAHVESLRKMGIPEEGHQCGGFTEGQRKYLEFHRESVFLCSALN
jgi:hypothetical protein